MEVRLLRVTRRLHLPRVALRNRDMHASNVMPSFSRMFATSVGKRAFIYAVHDVVKNQRLLFLLSHNGYFRKNIQQVRIRCRRKELTQIDRALFSNQRNFNSDLSPILNFLRASRNNARAVLRCNQDGASLGRSFETRSHSTLARSAVPR